MIGLDGRRTLAALLSFTAAASGTLAVLGEEALRACVVAIDWDLEEGLCTVLPADTGCAAGDAGEEDMSKIAYGSAQGTPFEEASDKDLRWYLGTQEEKLAKDPQGRFAQSQQRDIKEIKAILADRE